MNAVGNSWSAVLFIALVALLAHEPWRWAGMVLGRNIDVGSELFQWVRCVATALVSGLIIRLILFPAKSLAAVPLGLRVCAFVAGIAIFYAAKRSLAAGVLGGTALLIAGQWLLG